MNSTKVSIIIKKSSKYYKKKTLKNENLIRAFLFNKLKY